jgi:hypothetical protein
MFLMINSVYHKKKDEAACHCEWAKKPKQHGESVGALRVFGETGKQSSGRCMYFFFSFSL